MRWLVAACVTLAQSACGRIDFDPAGPLSLAPPPAKLNLNTSLQLTAVGGRAPYRFAATGAGTVDGAGHFVSGNYPGTATVTVTDLSGDTAGAQIEVGGDSLFVLGGSDGSLAHDEVWRSDDGVTWTMVGRLPTVRASGAALVYEDRLWYLGGFDSNLVVSTDIWTSTDGATWTALGPLPPSNCSEVPSIAHGDQIWLARYQCMLSTADGAAFGTLGDFPITIHAGQLADFAGRVWHVGGHIGSTTPTDILSTTDGVTWTTSAQTIPSGRIYHGFAPFAGRLWLAGGLALPSPSLQDVAVTDDGETWTPLGNTLPATRSGGVLIEYRGRLRFVGGGSAVWSTTDGISWTVDGSLSLVLSNAGVVAYTPP